MDGSPQVRLAGPLLTTLAHELEAWSVELQAPVRSHERTGSDGSSVFRRPPVDLHLPVAQVNQTSSSASTPRRLSSVESSRRSTARDSAAHH